MELWKLNFSHQPRPGHRGRPPGKGYDLLPAIAHVMAANRGMTRTEAAWAVVFPDGDRTLANPEVHATVRRLRTALQKEWWHLVNAMQSRAWAVKAEREYQAMKVMERRIYETSALQMLITANGKAVASSNLLALITNHRPVF